MPSPGRRFIHELPHLNTIKVGLLHLKPNAVNETITHCCRMVVRESDDPTLPLWRSGSATLVRYAGARYVIVSRHELGLGKGEIPSREILETIRISCGSGQLSNIPLKSCIFETSNLEEEFHDILIFEAADEWDTQTADAPYFFPLAAFSTLSRKKSFVVGYPTRVDVMEEYYERFYGDSIGTIHILRSIFSCDFDASYLSNAKHYRRYLTTGNFSNLDGYSGGAVFSLVGGLEDWEILLDGVVLRGGAGQVYVVDADFLVKAIEGRPWHA